LEANLCCHFSYAQWFLCLRHGFLLLHSFIIFKCIKDP
jgi:hypothetical protein